LKRIDLEEKAEKEEVEDGKKIKCKEICSSSQIEWE
jgi:hypothetical protein